jgi:hypothetical protein
MNRRIIDDHARATAKALLDLIAHNYRPEEHLEIWQAFTEVCRAGIESYVIESQRLESRVRPSKN